MDFSAFSAQDVSFMVVLALTLAFGSGCFFLARRLDRLGGENARLRSRAEQVLGAFQGRPQAAAPAPVAQNPAALRGGFSADLKWARLGTRLKAETAPREAPDRYRLLASLASRGVEPDNMDEALAILQVSSEEARQLIKLSRLSRQGRKQG
ncbi:MAG: hypothetical protein C0617_07535 [Desulfuromonas sp.]|uniref:hypothetical protein n=1 Tax=Desulfuromonas sp. TaxID=892 RepID=UPI000CB14957|nr:hypothetical protein [Desulfuromonas sp.]PLX84478.1 MAG: hypothetical protein C0617_07535 [Desulfuromonas sp.]